MAVIGLGMIVLSISTAATGTGRGTVVAAAAPVDGGESRQVVQGTVTRVDPGAGRAQIAVWIVWAPVLRVEDRTLEVSIGPATRFLPPAFGGRIRAGDEVQVSLVRGRDGRLQESKITVLDLD